MKIEISNHLFLSNIPDRLCLAIMDCLTLKYPAFAEAEKMGRWTGNLSRELRFYREEFGGLTVPRGFLGQLVTMARQSGIPTQTEDRRRTLPDVDFNFAGALKPFQAEAVAAMLSKDFGTLSSPTGSGKTVIACYLIAERRQPTLVIVHTKELLNQWIDRIEQFLSIPRAEIGEIGNGKNQIGAKITVGIINSIYPIAREIKQHFGQIIVDECHRCPSRTFSEAVSAFDSRFMLGLSATPFRRDGLSKLIGWHVGDILHEVSAAALVENGDILSADIISRETYFFTQRDASVEYSKVLSELTQDDDRNHLIVCDVAKEVRSNGNGVCLVLSDRKEHCRTLADMLSEQGINADVLTGDTSNSVRKATVQRLNGGDTQVLIATGPLIGEGFDCKGLSSLFMTTPIRFDGRVTQYLGRVLRPSPGKGKPRVYDYVDRHVGVLKASAVARQRVYCRRAATGGEYAGI
jgi:superfamily II DNA or RNA helicase